MTKDKKQLVIIDSNSLIHRAYHALPPLTTKRGELVNAVYGFLLVFLKAIKDFQPDFIAACFDFPAPTFRHKKYKEYKAKRPPAPEELYRQIPKVKEILDGFNVAIFEKEGYEADDIIGTIAKLASQKQIFPEIETIILSGDLDTLQLVNSQIRVYTCKKGVKDTVLYDEKQITERYQGLEPVQLLDFKSLKGDPSDNIPGVPGIGEKNAIWLMNEFGTLDSLYQEIEQNTEKSQKINDRIRKILKNYKDQALFSRELTKIKRDVSLDFHLKNCALKGYDKEKIIQFFKSLEFYSLIDKLPNFSGD